MHQQRGDPRLGVSGQSLYLEFLSSTYSRIAISKAASSANAGYAQSSVSRAAPAGTAFVRVFAYGSGSAGVTATFAYDGMTLTAE